MNTFCGTNGEWPRLRFAAQMASLVNVNDRCSDNVTVAHRVGEEMDRDGRMRGGKGMEYD